MKKHFIFIFVLIAIFSLTGCKKDNPTKEEYGVRFYIDDEIIYETTVLDEADIDFTAVKVPEQYIVIDWEGETNKENGKKYFDFHLEYSIKQLILTINVDGYDEEKYQVTYGSSFELSTYNVPTGYYLSWNYDLSVLDNITTDLNLTGTFVAYEKETTYYIDGEVVKKEVTPYYVTVSAPTIPDKVKTYNWVKTEEFKDGMYYVTMNLEYTIKGGTIKYFDGNVLLDLSPSSYITGDEVELPVYEKEGYEFIGWFASDISLYRYVTIPESSEDNLVLYARFVQTSNFTDFVLPEATYHFTDIIKTPFNLTYLYQPVLPSDAQSGVTNYTWTTSDPSVASVSEWSSLTGKKSGFCVLTATLKSDPSITINGVIKVTSEGIFYSSVEEANTHDFCKVTFVGMNDEVIYEQLVEKGGSVIPPTPLSYEGYAFAGWDHELYGIESNVTISANYTLGTNPYAGKKFAIIGDSISTYQGYIPEGYSYFYPYPSADLFDVNQTWWMQVINRLGAGLFVNNSYSGSCVSTGGSSATNSDLRLASTKINLESPDVILIYMGSNDCVSISVQNFRTQYKVMLDKLKKLCPNAEIILCTLPTSNLYKEANKELFNEVITDYANSYNLKLVNLGDTDITNDLVDSAHPKRSGHTLIANKIISELFKED